MRTPACPELWGSREAEPDLGDRPSNGERLLKGSWGSCRPRALTLPFRLGSLFSARTYLIRTKTALDPVGANTVTSAPCPVPLDVRS